MNRARQRGSVLVEFALVSLVLWTLFAVAIDFGRLMFSAQALQDAARIAARELAIRPLRADFVPMAPGESGGFDAALQDPTVISQIFNPACLVIDLNNPDTDTDSEIDAFLATLPVVNKALVPLMFVDLSGGRRLLRYPGALLVDSSGSGFGCGTQPATGFVVAVPEVVSHNPETIRWLRVVEEVRRNPDDWTTGSFNLSDPNDPPDPTVPRGLIAIRFNYPYEAAAISSFQPNPAGPAEATITNPNYADEGGVIVSPDTPTPGETIEDDPDVPGPFGPYTGPYGLGRQLAFASTVRPYSRVLAGQAIARREIFLPPPPEVTP